MAIHYISIGITQSTNERAIMPTIHFPIGPMCHKALKIAVAKTGCASMRELLEHYSIAEAIRLYAPELADEVKKEMGV